MHLSVILLSQIYNTLPGDRVSGIGFILFSSIFACKAVMLNGSTVYGRHPVNIAYMLTPLQNVIVNVED